MHCLWCKTAGEGEAMIFAKVHVINNKKLVAVCDSDLLGKKLEEKDTQLDLTGDFYKGEEVSEAQFMEMVKGAYTVNIVGKEAVELGIKNGLIKKESIITISGIPHAQAFVVE